MTDRESMSVVDLGFHGDRYLLDLVADCMPIIGAFIETGTNVGSTARYVCTEYPGVPVYSCEPSADAYAVAQRTLAGFPKSHLYQLPSPDFLHHLYGDRPELAGSTNLFYLDAHGFGFEWPLKDEVAFITGKNPCGLILIDDFEVPGEPQFGFCEYDGHRCGFPLIEQDIRDIFINRNQPVQRQNRDVVYRSQ